MMRLVTGVLICSVFVCGVVLYGECEGGGEGQQWHYWWAADSAWSMKGLGKVKREAIQKGMERVPEKAVALLMYAMIASEEGEWFTVRLKLRGVKKVTFTKNTKIVVTDKEGRRVESEAIVFWPDELQTSLYDSRKSPVVVTRSSVWQGPDGGYPSGCVKFPVGSVELGNIVSFEVVGAVEDRGSEEVR
jgi:hypothetical protein